MVFSIDQESKLVEIPVLPITNMAFAKQPLCTSVHLSVKWGTIIVPTNRVVVRINTL